MLRRKLKIGIVLASILLLLTVAFLKKDDIYVLYIKLVKKTTLIEHYSDNKLNGEVIGYINGTFMQEIIT